jgi:hypothetical protein
MGERDDRIEALKRAEGSTRSGLGSVERKHENDRNAPGADTDAQISALTSRRNSLQEQLAKVQGELSELERGRDAERKAALGANAQESKQQISPSDQNRADAAVQSDRVKQEVSQQPGTTNHTHPNSPPPHDISDPQGTQWSRNDATPSGSGAPAGDPDPTASPNTLRKGFGPFEPGGPPGGFDPADVSSSVVPFERPRPGEGFPGEWQEKTPPSWFKPFSDVLHNKQVAELDALDETLKGQDAPDSKEQLALDAEKKKLGLETDAASQEFDRNQFEKKVDQMHRMFNEHDRERQQLDANEHVVNREMDLKRYDMTRDLCHTRAEQEIAEKHVALKNEETRKNEVLLEQNAKRLSGREDAEIKQKAYEKDLADDRAKFDQKLQTEFPGQVNQRTDELQQQHFPAVVQNGPEVYFPQPAPALGSAGPSGGPPPPAM